MARPYMQCTAAELKILVEKPGATSETVQAVLAELAHRSTKSARKLRDELCAKHSVPTPGGTNFDTSTENRETVHAKQEPDPSKPPPEFEWRFNALRLTFTAEAEILAKWGITPALPDDIRESVFDAWRSKLIASPDELGRSADRLATDIAKLEEESAMDRAMQRKEGTTP